MINIKHIVLNSWKISYKKYITWVALIKVSNGELVCGFKFKYLSYFNLYILIFNWSSALIWFCCCCVLRFPPRPKKNMKYRNYRYYILFFLNVYCFHGKLYYDEKTIKTDLLGFHLGQSHFWWLLVELCLKLYSKLLILILMLKM